MKVTVAPSKKKQLTFADLKPGDVYYIKSDASKIACVKLDCARVSGINFATLGAGDGGWLGEGTKVVKYAAELIVSEEQ